MSTLRPHFHLLSEQCFGKYKNGKYSMCIVHIEIGRGPNISALVPLGGQLADNAYPVGTCYTFHFILSKTLLGREMEMRTKGGHESA